MIAGVPYDAEVEFVRISDGQYTLLDYTPNENTVCEISVMPIVNPRMGVRGFFGSEDANNVNSLTILFEDDQWAANLIQFRFGGGYNQTSVVQFTEGNFYNIKVSKDGGFANGVKVVNFSYATISNSKQTKFGIGCDIRNGGILFTSGTYDYYGLKIEDGIFSADLIPVRVGQVGYMYDRVTRKLFGNKGTGAFVLGPDVATPVMGLRRYPQSRLGKMGARHMIYGGN